MRLALPGLVAIIIMFMMVPGVWAETLAQTWEKTATLVESDNAIVELALSPDGGTLAVSELTKPGAQIIDAKTGEVKHDLSVTGNPTPYVGNLDYSPDGSILYGGSGLGTGVYAWDAQSGKQVGTFAVGAYGPEVAVNPTSSGTGMNIPGGTPSSSPLPVLAVEDRQGTVNVRTAADTPVSGSPVRVMDRTATPGQIYDIEFTSDGSAVAAVGVDGTGSNRHGEYCEVIKNERTGKYECWKYGGITLPSFPIDVDVAPDGAHSAVGVNGGEVIVIDRKTGKQTKLQAHDKGVVCVEYFPDGRLATGGSNGEVKIWDMATQTCVSQFDTGEQSVREIEISGDNTTIFTGGVDGTVQRWDAVPTPAPTPMPNM